MKKQKVRWSPPKKSKARNKRASNWQKYQIKWCTIKDEARRTQAGLQKNTMGGSVHKKKVEKWQRQVVEKSQQDA